jgi:HPt (histidine-containing phosphotransfer) domain-containing protein
MSAFEAGPLLDLFDDDRVEVGNLLSIACRSVDEDLETIALALAAQDARKIAERTHHIKGTSGSIGAHELRAAALQLESEARSESWPAMPMSFEALRAAGALLATDVSLFRAAGQKGSTA